MVHRCTYAHCGAQVNLCPLWCIGIPIPPEVLRCSYAHYGAQVHLCALWCPSIAIPSIFYLNEIMISGKDVPYIKLIYSDCFLHLKNCILSQLIDSLVSGIVVSPIR